MLKLSSDDGQAHPERALFHRREPGRVIAEGMPTRADRKDSKTMSYGSKLVHPMP